MPLDITTMRPDPALLDLPWSTPLDEWPEDILAALPRGISRHTVRFVKVTHGVIAVKEIREDVAWQEYHMLRALNRLAVPCVQPVGVVTGRVDREGNPLDACLLTKHLTYSLPFRILFGQALRRDTAQRLIDALAVLLVRLHLIGFFWGDVSLSNTLFRRDAGEFAAYLVDAETGELRDTLSTGQREHDLDIAQVNIAGELFDLEAGGLLPEGVDPVAVSLRIIERYRELWSELTDEESFDTGEKWRIEDRIRRLNDLGFDIGELAMSTDIDGARVIISPKVVEAGHHSRRLLHLTGLDVGENQARRLLNDLDAFRAALDMNETDEQIVANRWLHQIYLPVTHMAPPDLLVRMPAAELFHEVLEHRWYMAQRLGHDLPIEDAARDYISHVLPTKSDERTVVDTPTVEMPVVDWDDDANDRPARGGEIVGYDHDGQPIRASSDDDWTAEEDDSDRVLNDWNPDWRTR